MIVRDARQGPNNTDGVRLTTDDKHIYTAGWAGSELLVSQHAQYKTHLDVVTWRRWRLGCEGIGRTPAAGRLEWARIGGQAARAG